MSSVIRRLGEAMMAYLRTNGDDDDDNDDDDDDDW